MTYGEFKQRYRIALDSQQETAVQAVAGPVLLLAVPGSGKTTVLVTRLGFLVNACGVQPEEILTVTYTVSAARDMQQRFASLFGDTEAERMEFRTINSLADRIIRRYEYVKNRRAFTLLSGESRQASILGEIYRRTSRDFPTESTIKTLQTAITYVKNQMLSDSEVEEWKPDGLDFAPVYREYCRVLREQCLMDFDDQLVYAYRILRQCPDILRDFRRRYRYICVDEAQDTSKIQHALIRLLAQENGNLFMVGDEDQSIYGFRAAYPEELLQFETVYSGGQVLLLERNYRSTRQIVEAADGFIQKNQMRHPKRMQAARGEGPSLIEIPVYDRRAQYRYLKRVAEDCRVETAVLYRDNDSALPVIDLLHRAGISYRCRQVDSSFFTHPSIRDVTQIIRFAQNPLDGDRFLEIYYKLGAGISKASALAAVAESHRRKEPVLEALLEQPALSNWTRKQCKALQTHLTNLLTEPADRAVYRIVHFMGYGEYLDSRGADANKVQILESLGEAEPTPTRLLERLEELCQIVREGSTDPDCRFLLSTIHSSKGLEYERVILMDVIDGFLPKLLPNECSSPEELAAIEEERRLFYVGMTRAKQELAIFRFRKSELISTFSGELFPNRQSAFHPAPKPVRGALPPESLEQEAAAYVLGTRVVHRSFGTGQVTACADGVVTIRFGHDGERRFSLSAALEKGLLTREDY